MSGLISTLRSDRAFFSAQKLYSNGSYDDAISAYDKALAIKPEDPMILLHKALVLSDNNQYEEAVNTIQRAIDLKPSSAPHHLFLGRIHFDHHKFEDASQAFEKASSLDSSNVLVSCLLALTSLAMHGSSDEAYNTLRTNINNTNPEFQGRCLLYCESQLQRTAETKTEQKLDSSQIVDSGSSHLPVDMTAALKPISSTASDLDQTLSKFFLKIRYFSNHDKYLSRIYYLEGARERLRNHPDEACHLFEQALEFDKELLDAKLELIEVLHEKRDFIQARKHLLPLVQALDSENNQVDSSTSSTHESSVVYRNVPEDVRVMLGIVHYELKEYQKAIEQLNQKCEDSSKDFRPFYYMGLSLVTSGSEWEAKCYFVECAKRAGFTFVAERLEAMINAI